MLDITGVLSYRMFMNIGQFHHQSYGFSLNQPLMTSISKSFSDGHHYQTITIRDEYTDW